MEYLIKWENDHGQEYYVKSPKDVDWLLENAVGFDFDCIEDYLGETFCFTVVERSDGFFESLTQDE